MILQRASWDLVPQFIELLETKYPEETSAIAKLKYHYEFHKKYPDENWLFFTPDGKFDEFGTFVLTIPELRNDTFISTVNPEWEDFANALADSPFFPFSEGLVAGPLPQRLFPFFEYLMTKLENKACVSWASEFLTLEISKESALALQVSLPDDVKLDVLNETHATIVNDYWEYGKTSQSLLELKTFIGAKDSMGLFLKATGELIAWCIMFDYGGLGAIFVKEEFRRKGYGKIVAAEQTKRIAAWGYRPKVFVRPNNVSSLRLFESLGYEKRGIEKWLHVSKKQ